MGRRDREGIITSCAGCGVESRHLRVAGEWQLRITYMPDEKAWLFWPCAGCGEWRSQTVSVNSIHRLLDMGVTIDDLSEVDAGAELRTMPTVGPAEADHIRWLGEDAPSATVQGVMLAAALKILAIDEHPADGAS